MNIITTVKGEKEPRDYKHERKTVKWPGETGVESKRHRARRKMLKNVKNKSVPLKSGRRS